MARTRNKQYIVPAIIHHTLGVSERLRTCIIPVDKWVGNTGIKELLKQYLMEHHVGGEPDIDFN